VAGIRDSGVGRRADLGKHCPFPEKVFGNGQLAVVIGVLGDRGKRIVKINISIDKNSINQLINHYSYE
jgi:hypothetical protein